jgi:TetR/AcrR family transcriptional regulator, tetracycline repressor protein
MPATPKRRGRPARLSRDLIVGAAVDIVEKDGLPAVTMKSVAEAVNATPMSLYRHIPDRDALIAAVTQELLATLEFDIPEAADWRAGVETWMRNVRAHFSARPAALGALGYQGRVDREWMRVNTELIPPLKKSGLAEGDLLFALMWISRLTAGVVIQETSMALGKMATPIANVLPDLEEADAALWSEVWNSAPSPNDDLLFDALVAQVVSTIEGWIRDGAPNE